MSFRKTGGICGFISAEAVALQQIGAGLAMQVFLLALSAALVLGATGVIGKDASGNSDRQKKK